MMSHDQLKSRFESRKSQKAVVISNAVASSIREPHTCRQHITLALQPFDGSGGTRKFCKRKRGIEVLFKTVFWRKIYFVPICKNV